MMNEETVDKIVNTWGSREYKGRGRIIIPSYFDSRAIILRLLQKVYANHYPKVYVLVNTFNDRTALANYITNQSDIENNEEFRKLIREHILIIVTESLFSRMNYMFKDTYIITYNVSKFEERTITRIQDSKFIFILSYAQVSNSVNNIPQINIGTANEIDNLRVTTPVEEYQIGVHIDESSNDYEQLNKLNDYIAKALNIFENFDNINKARSGDPDNNLSANDVCIKIAKENGWNEHLDMSLPFNQKLDETYNPNELADLAFNAYDFIRERKNILSSYEGKIDAIKNIINNENDIDKLLIVCKKGNFAIQVAQELNRVYGKDFCRPICDKLKPIEAIDINGNPIYYKSGKQKGKRKELGCIAQQTLYNNMYNINKIKCLVLSNAPSPKLSGDVKTIIITSPSCMTIEEYMYRLSHITYSNNKLNLYSLFCVDTQEQKQILRTKTTKYHKIVKNSEQVDDNGNFVPKIFVD